MTRGGGKRGGRSVTPEEAHLWSQLARSVDKVRGKPRVADRGGNPASETTPLPAPAAPPKSAAAAPRPARPRPPATPEPAPLAGFDRRTARQVASGRIRVDARLDLHGMHQHDAHQRLRAFLAQAQASGHRTVLVITGKGAGTGPRDHLSEALGEASRGVLRRNVPHWLEQADLRSIVLSYTSASPRHGGDGALYVQLRKPRSE